MSVIIIIIIIIIFTFIIRCRRRRANEISRGSLEDDVHPVVLHVWTALNSTRPRSLLINAHGYEIVAGQTAHNVV